jgi:hypothetical protein
MVTFLTIYSIIFPQLISFLVVLLPLCEVISSVHSLLELALLVFVSVFEAVPSIPILNEVDNVFLQEGVPRSEISLYQKTFRNYFNQIKHEIQKFPFVRDFVNDNGQLIFFKKIREKKYSLELGYYKEIDALIGKKWNEAMKALVTTGNNR